jgi:Fanconi anemia group J protein
VHDIEDLARIGSRHKACPYFAARHLADTAELVFCPYSYLLDPNIRRATKVRLLAVVMHAQFNSTGEMIRAVLVLLTVGRVM